MRVEIQDIFAAHMTSYMEGHPLNLVQRKAVRNIMDCRTAALGAHIDTCDNCGYTKISYNSCRNRHCPKCQTVAKEKWIDKQRQHLLDIPYFHVVFTVPSDLLESCFSRSPGRPVLTTISSCFRNGTGAVCGPEISWRDAWNNCCAAYLGTKSPVSSSYPYDRDGWGADQRRKMAKF